MKAQKGEFWMINDNDYPQTIAGHFDAKFRLITFDRNNPKQHRDAVGDLNDQFKQALADAYLLGHNAAIQDKVFELAWADCHSSGYNEVEIMYRSCADLVLFVIENAKES